MSGIATIEAHGLTRKFGDFIAVEGISFEAREGEVLGFLGPNGAGKTTTIRMLSGIIAPSSGYGVVAGRRTDDKVEELHEVIGLLTESPGLYERLSARRNLEYFAGFYAGLDVAADVPAFLSCEARHRGYKVDRSKRDESLGLHYPLIAVLTSSSKYG